MPFGLFGPVTFRTKKGNKITFFAGFITFPLTGLSLWALLRSGRPGGDARSGGGKQLPPPELDLSDK